MAGDYEPPDLPGPWQDPQSLHLRVGVSPTPVDGGGGWRLEGKGSWPVLELPLASPEGPAAYPSGPRGPLSEPPTPRHLVSSSPPSSSGVQSWDVGAHSGLPFQPQKTLSSVVSVAQMSTPALHSHLGPN